MTEREIIEYGIAAGENHYQLADIVNKQIKAGFQPFEKPFLIQHGEQPLLMQVMVKYEVKKKTKI